MVRVHPSELARLGRRLAALGPAAAAAAADGADDDDLCLLGPFTCAELRSPPPPMLGGGDRDGAPPPAILVALVPARDVDPGEAEAPEWALAEARAGVPFSPQCYVFPQRLSQVGDASVAVGRRGDPS